MSAQNYTASFLVDQSPETSFNAICNVKGWWTANTKGNTQQLHDEFEVSFGDVHYSKQKIAAALPGAKLSWLVTDSKLGFVKNKNEWTGTEIVFDIAKQGDKTLVSFTHQGLSPGHECFTDCSNAWSGYLHDSLRNLIANGKGNPAAKDN